MQYPLILTEGNLLIDNSSHELIQSCLQKAGYGLSLRKELARDKTALKYGGIIHRILEERYKHGTGVTREVQQAMIDCAMEEFGKWQPPMEDFRNLDRAIDVIQQYNKVYPKETFTIVPFQGRTGVETPFMVPIFNIVVNRDMLVLDLADEDKTPRIKHIEELPVIYTGRIDMLVEGNMGLYLFDHKTTSIAGAVWLADFYTGSQFKGYCWAVRELRGDKNYPLGVIINGLIGRKPTKSGKGIDFLRHSVDLNPETIDEWKDSLYINLNLYLYCLQEQRFPMQTTACCGKYGKCDYYDICILAPQHRRMMLASGQYVDKTWDPINGDKNE